MNKVSSFYFFCLLFIVSCAGNKNQILDNEYPGLNNESVHVNSQDMRAAVFFFLAPECPLCENYSKHVKEYASKYKDLGVDFYAVFSGDWFREDEIAAYIARFKIPIPVIQDRNMELTRSLGANVTPEVFILDSSGMVRYSGKIDNWMKYLGVKRRVVNEFYVQDALEAILNNKEIEVKHTDAVGCLIEK